MYKDEPLGYLDREDITLLEGESYKTFKSKTHPGKTINVGRQLDDNIPIDKPFNILFKSGRVSTLTVEHPGGLKQRQRRTIRTPFGNIMATTNYQWDQDSDSRESNSTTKFIQNPIQKRNSKIALGGIGLGIGSGIAYGKKDRIRKSISNIQNRIRYYKDKKHYGPIIAKLKQMLYNLKSKLNER